MERFHRILVLAALIGLLLPSQSKAQVLPASSGSIRALDALLQDYAYRVFIRPQTGVPYDGTVPSNFTGIKIAALRLRSGSLRNRGVKSYKEFNIPMGVFVQPYVERVVLVYQNLGNWSSLYYPLPGYTYLAPVLSLLAYDGANLSATSLPELDLVVSKSPMSINFTDAFPVPRGFTAKCVWFGLDGLPEFRDLLSANSCTTYRQGHFSIVVNSTGLPPPAQGPGVIPRVTNHNKSKKWKIIGSVIGGIIALFLLALLVFWILYYRQNKKVAYMERLADAGVALQMLRIGDTQAPVASGTRTLPVLENEYVA